MSKLHVEIVKHTLLSEVLEGGNIKIRCPYHQERVPSCVIYEDSFYCFGCGKSGSLQEILAVIKGE